MQITIDTSVPLSDNDRDILNILVGNPRTVGEVAQQATTPKAAAKKAAAKPEPTPEPEPEPEDLVGGGDDADDEQPTMEDAVKIATEMVSSGKSAKVKAALAEVGAKKVSELKAADIAGFVNTLTA